MNNYAWREEEKRKPKKIWNEIIIELIEANDIRNIYEKIYRKDSKKYEIQIKIEQQN